MSIFQIRYGRLSFVLILVFVYFVSANAEQNQAVSLWRSEADDIRLGDPDIRRIVNQSLVAIYRETIVAIRTVYVDVHDAGLDLSEREQRLDELKRTPKSSEHIAIILDGAKNALEEQPPNWDQYRAALWATQTGMVGDPGFVPIARSLLERPRGEKISDAEGWAIRETLQILGINETTEEAELLGECATDEYWRGTPPRSRLFGDNPSSCMAHVRGNALNSLGRMPIDLCLPILEALSEKYPDVGPGGRTVKWDVVVEDTLKDGFGYSVESTIWKAKKLAGLPVGLHPFEKHHGKTFEELEQELLRQNPQLRSR